MEKYDLMQRLMLRAPFLLSKLTIPYMRRNGDGTGVIGHMASIHAHICTKNKPVYNITKFGLRALAQSIAAEGEGKIATSPSAPASSRRRSPSGRSRPRPTSAASPRKKW